MPGLLTSTPVGDEERRANDRHRPLVVAAVLALLTVYIYLFTQAASDLGLTPPRDLAIDLGIYVEAVFDSDRNVESNVSVQMTREYDSDDERLILFLVFVGAFLSCYFLPLPLKQPSLVLWTLGALLILYGTTPTSALLLAHLGVYLVLHPEAKHNLWTSALAGVAANAAFGPEVAAPVANAAVFAGFALAFVAVNRFAVQPLLRLPQLAPAMRTLAVQSTIVTICLGVLMDAGGASTLSLALGLVMFGWQWPRITMYHIDYKDGMVPKDLPLMGYLAVFFNPGVIPKWNWGVTIPQGYAYINNNFLCEDKNRIVIGGVRLLGVALLYLVFWNWFRLGLADLIGELGVEVYRCHTRSMVEHFMAGGQVTTLSVLLTTLLDLLRFLLLFGSVMHFKVGIWRILGYRIDSYYDRPWLATNLVNLWSRYAFHYREFLVRAFYYPVFFRLFKKRPMLRVFVASMSAAAVGNFIWHVNERVFFRDPTVAHLMYVVDRWPYFVLLGLGIASYQLFRMRYKSTRKPWTWDRWIASDVLAAYCTLQFFGLIHVFMRPAAGATVWDLFRLFMVGLGVHIPE